VPYILRTGRLKFQQRFSDEGGGNLTTDSDSTHDAPDPVAYGRQTTSNRRPERESTDQSLRQERDKTDRALATRQADMARRADAMVDHARNTADAVLSVARDTAEAVLDAARDKADERRLSGGGNSDQAALEEERGVADNALQAERKDAEEVLREERDEYARALRTFLPLGRESTDRSLRSERIRADQAVVNRDDFLAIVAHDLRGMLNGILLSSALLAQRAERDNADASTLAETVRIGRYVARMERLIGDLVDIASVDAGKLAVAPSSGYLAGPIAEAADAFQTAAASKGITLESRVGALPLQASFDHNRILQVLGNLVSNALKYTPRGGKITLVGVRDDGGVRLTVSDTGSGIPEEALESIFERFTQVGANGHGGLGLGLYISRCLVQAHGGSIRAESDPGAGTRICLTLPGNSSRSSSTAS
jgi:signal transduction histidine kinase